MNRDLRVVVAAACLFLPGPNNAAAQASNATAVNDTTIARIVMTGAIAQLAHHIAQAAMDTPRTTSWHITLPRDTTGLWAAFEAHVLRIVRGQKATPNSTRSAVLSIGPIQLRGDSLVAHVYVGERFLCLGRQTGNGTEYEVRAMKHGTAWSAPLTVALAFGDAGGPCSP